MICEQAEGDVNVLDNKDYSPLHWACYNGQSVDQVTLTYA